MDNDGASTHVGDTRVGRRGRCNQDVVSAVMAPNGVVLNTMDNPLGLPYGALLASCVAVTPRRYMKYNFVC